jgi:hypothetical protein
MAPWTTRQRVSVLTVLFKYESAVRVQRSYRHFNVFATLQEIGFSYDITA